MNSLYTHLLPFLTVTTQRLRILFTRERHKILTGIIVPVRWGYNGTVLAILIIWLPGIPFSPGNVLVVIPDEHSFRFTIGQA